MATFTLRVLLCVLLLTALPAVAGEQDGHGHRRTVVVMTRNLYFGADLGPVLAAADIPALIDAVSHVYAAAVASDIERRMGAIADELAKARPDLIGLQEAALWRTGDVGSVAEDTAFDLIELLVNALATRGLDYDIAAQTTNFDAQAPGMIDGALREIRLTDRDAILVRRGGDRGGLRWSPQDVQAANFTTAVTFPTPIVGPITIPRGWAALDVTIGGSKLRFVTAHLETISPAVQMAQAQELLLGPARTELPLILVCDCNSSANGEGPDATPTYGALITAGLDDAWTAVRGDAPGFTCCQAADLSNVRSTLSERIDLILLRGDIDVHHARVTGVRPADRIPPPRGRWASDHAGVTATLHLPSIRFDD